MTKDEALQLALKALENSWTEPNNEQYVIEKEAITALRLSIDMQNMASKSTYKEQLETKDEEVEEAHHIIYKSCINQPHWKRSAMRYLKRNAPMLHHQAVHEFNEHPDGRGKE